MTVAELSQFLSGVENLKELRKLQTSFFLAQHRSGCEVYRFRVRCGKVLSDELDQDLAQMTANGWIRPAVGVEDRQVHWRFPQDRPPEGKLSKLEALLREHLLALAQHRTDALEAAATRVWFEDKGRSHVMARLRWLDHLSPDDAAEAEQILPTGGQE